MDILVSRNPDSGNMETGIPERKPPLIGLINTHKESNECQAQSRRGSEIPGIIIWQALLRSLLTAL